MHLCAILLGGIDPKYLSHVLVEFTKGKMKQKS